MIDVPMKTNGPLDKQSILSINRNKTERALSAQTILSINQKKNPVSQHPTRVQSQPQAVSQTIRQMQIPVLPNAIKKGQKVPLETTIPITGINAYLGWNISNPACEVDVSAFMLGADGKVLGDSWFVFYGQEQSPDKSTIFHSDITGDREMISIDFTKINPGVSKVVFVLTIHEALEKHLNFSMLKDAYIRITDSQTGVGLVSFKMDEYYANVTSMMIGEIYKYNNSWKFNAIGNGVARDLAGLCQFYGVEVI